MCTTAAKLILLYFYNCKKFFLVKLKLRVESFLRFLALRQKVAKVNEWIPNNFFYFIHKRNSLVGLTRISDKSPQFRRIYLDDLEGPTNKLSEMIDYLRGFRKL